MGMLLQERSNPTMSYIKESSEYNGKLCLGILEGIGADFKNPTRNGRRYPLELWENVQKSPDFIEGMKTLTILGENDHPETRADTSIKEVSIVLLEFNIDKTDGVVRTKFGILDTPQGRILKSLLDFGCKIGVSSRGIGDEVVRDGETIIDPDTYIFYGFDAVVTPAVAEARPAVIESANRKNLAESFSKEIENASCEAELKSIKRIAETIKLPDLDSITESVDKKLNSIANGEDISAKLETDLGNLAKENEELKLTISKLESKLSANNIRLKKMKTQMKENINNSRSMSKELQKNLKTVASLEDSIIESAQQMDEMENLIESTKSRYMNKIRSISESNKSLKSQINDLTEDLEKSESKNIMYSNKLESLKESYENKLDESRKSNRALKNKIDNLNEQLSSKESSIRLTEQKSQSNETILKKKLQESKAETKKATLEYMRIKCAESGIDMSTIKNRLPETYTIDDVNQLVSELTDRKQRFNKVPVAIRPRTAIVSESFGSISESDRQTMSILSGSFK